MQPICLTIAGSDPSGGAGIQADLKTFHQFGVYGEAAVTLLTVQNTVGVSRVECLSPDLVAAQIQAVIDDIPPLAAKTGALGTAATIETVADLAGGFHFPLVVDPVMISKHGASLLPPDAVTVLKNRLLPVCFLLTPNLPEASALIGKEVSDLAAMRAAAQRIQDMGARNVLIKGGHLETGMAIDVLLTGREWIEFPAPRIDTRHTHGTGCTYSAAIAACLAHGLGLPESVERSKRFIQKAIETAPRLGAGSGPVNHFASPGE